MLARVISPPSPDGVQGESLDRPVFRLQRGYLNGGQVISRYVVMNQSPSVKKRHNQFTLHLALRRETCKIRGRVHRSSLESFSPRPNFCPLISRAPQKKPSPDFPRQPPLSLSPFPYFQSSEYAQRSDPRHTSSMKNLG